MTMEYDDDRIVAFAEGMGFAKKIPGEISELDIATEGALRYATRAECLAFANGVHAAKSRMDQEQPHE